MGSSLSAEKGIIHSPRARHVQPMSEETLRDDFEVDANVEDEVTEQPSELKSFSHPIDDTLSPKTRREMSFENTDSFEHLEVVFPPGFSRNSSRFSSRRTSVSAEADKDEKSTKRYVPKTPEQTALVKKTLDGGTCFLFMGLDEEQKTDILNAVQIVEKKTGDVIIKQWDGGDNFYIIARGQVDVFKTFGPQNDPGEEKFIYSYQDEGYFGELALMYNSPRTATIRAMSDDVMLLALDRGSFRDIIIESTRKKRELYEDFIMEVPLLKNMIRGAISQIADTMGVAKFSKGEVIVKEGDQAEEMYIIESGECRVITTLTQEEAVEERDRLESTADLNDALTAATLQSLTAPEPALDVGVLKRGDYFGERALLVDEKRSATVTASTDCVLLVIKRDIFERLFGPLVDVMQEKMSGYKGLASPRQENLNVPKGGHVRGKLSRAFSAWEAGADLDLSSASIAVSSPEPPSRSVSRGEDGVEHGQLLIPNLQIPNSPTSEI